MRRAAVLDLRCIPLFCGLVGFGGQPMPSKPQEN
jgi:hypothetical protein